MPRHISLRSRNFNNYTAILTKECGLRRCLNRNVHAHSFISDIWLNVSHDQRLRRHLMWTEIEILKVRLKIPVSALYGIKNWNKSVEHNSPPGQVLQGEPKPGMPSLLLLTRERRTCHNLVWHQFIYKIYVSVITKFYTKKKNPPL